MSNNVMGTIPVSDCCKVRVYIDFTSPQLIKELQSRGLIVGKDFQPLVELDMCSGCQLPCRVIHKPESESESEVRRVK